jgi:tRNA threonylcarbamoyladenosine biosynthesis protein TsaE
MPILDPNSLEFISHGAEYTQRVAMRLGAMLMRGDVICLAGELGSGKTTFVQGLAAGWGSYDQVTSPTFVLVNLYRRPDGNRLFHLDAFRIASPAEAEDMDLDAILEGGVLVVEWADRIQSTLPADHLWIKLRTIDAEQRDLIFTARGNHYQAILDNFRKRIYGG